MFNRVVENAGPADLDPAGSEEGGRPVHCHGRTYIFIIIHGDSFLSEVRQELDRQMEPFGEALGSKGAVFAPFKSKMSAPNEEFWEKDWPEKILD